MKFLCFELSPKTHYLVTNILALLVLPAVAILNINVVRYTYLYLPTALILNIIVISTYLVTFFGVVSLIYFLYKDNFSTDLHRSYITTLILCSVLFFVCTLALLVVGLTAVPNYYRSFEIHLVFASMGLACLTLLFSSSRQLRDLLENHGDALLAEKPAPHAAAKNDPAPPKENAENV